MAPERPGSPCRCAPAPAATRACVPRGPGPPRAPRRLAQAAQERTLAGARRRPPGRRAGRRITPALLDIPPGRTRPLARATTASTTVGHRHVDPLGASARSRARSAMPHGTMWANIARSVVDIERERRAGCAGGQGRSARCAHRRRRSCGASVPCGTHPDARVPSTRDRPRAARVGQRVDDHLLEAVDVARARRRGRPPRSRSGRPPAGPARGRSRRRHGRRAPARPRPSPGRPGRGERRHGPPGCSVAGARGSAGSRRPTRRPAHAASAIGLVVRDRPERADAQHRARPQSSAAQSRARPAGRRPAPRNSET